jgi:hypothetical protein
MAIVAGADFGTLSVRVTLLDSERGRLGTAIAEYPLHRKRVDPDYATQSHRLSRVFVASVHSNGQESVPATVRLCAVPDLCRTPRAAEYLLPRCTPPAGSRDQQQP